MIRLFGRIIKFGFQNVVRNAWLSLATVSILILALLSVNFFILAQGFLESTLVSIEKKIVVSVYARPNISEKEFFALVDRLKAMPQVASIDYVSREDALSRLKDKFEKDGNTLITDTVSQLDENPLTESFVVHAKQVEDYPAIMEVLSEQQYDSLVEKKKFDDRSMLIAKVQILKNRLQQASILVNAFFALIAVLIVYNTIRITIYSRRREFGIMKLVGATNSFIRGPLLIEGIWYALISTVLTVLILFPILGFLQPYTEQFFDGQAFDVLGYFSSNFVEFFGTQFLAVIFLTIVSTLFAMSRYLKV